MTPSRGTPAGTSRPGASGTRAPSLRPRTSLGHLVSVAALVGGLTASPFPPPLSAQTDGGEEVTELRGTVTVIHGSRVRVELTGDRVPARGDTARLSVTVEGQGEVTTGGTWMVAEVESGRVWLEPRGEAAPVSPGYRATIWSADPVRPRPGTDPGAARAARGVPLLTEDFEGESIVSESDGPPCRKRVRDGTLVVQGLSERHTCWTRLSDAGTLEGDVRVSVRLEARGGTAGLVFGIFENDRGDDEYFVLSVDDAGRYRVRASDGREWTQLRGWTEDPSVRAGGPNDLSVEIVGDAVEMYANGRSLPREARLEARPGYVGLWVAGEGARAVVDEVRLVQLAPPATDRRPGAVRRVLFRHDLDDREPGVDSENAACRFVFRDGGYAVRNIADRGTSCHTTFRAFAPLEAGTRFSASMRLEDGPVDQPFGLLFGRPADARDPYHVFEIDAQGRYKLVRYDGDGWSELTPWIRSVHVAPGREARNELAVELSGAGTAHLFANGRHLRTVRLPVSGVGHVGLYVDEPGAEVLFDDLQLVALEEKR